MDDIGGGMEKELLCLEPGACAARDASVASGGEDEGLVGTGPLGDDADLSDNGYGGRVVYADVDGGVGG